MFGAWLDVFDNNLEHARPLIIYFSIWIGIVKPVEVLVWIFIGIIMIQFVFTNSEVVSAHFCKLKQINCFHLETHGHARDLLSGICLTYDWNEQLHIDNIDEQSVGNVKSKANLVSFLNFILDSKNNHELVLQVVFKKFQTCHTIW